MSDKNSKTQTSAAGGSGKIEFPSEEEERAEDWVEVQLAKTAELEAAAKRNAERVEIECYLKEAVGCDYTATQDWRMSKHTLDHLENGDAEHFDGLAEEMVLFLPRYAKNILEKMREKGLRPIPATGTTPIPSPTARRSAPGKKTEELDLTSSALPTAPQPGFAFTPAMMQMFAQQFASSLPKAQSSTQQTPEMAEMRKELAEMRETNKLLLESMTEMAATQKKAAHMSAAGSDRDLYGAIGEHLAEATGVAAYENLGATNRIFVDYPTLEHVKAGTVLMQLKDTSTLQYFDRVMPDAKKYCELRQCVKAVLEDEDQHGPARGFLEARTDVVQGALGHGVLNSIPLQGFFLKVLTENRDQMDAEELAAMRFLLNCTMQTQIVFDTIHAATTKRKSEWQKIVDLLFLFDRNPADLEVAGRGGALLAALPRTVRGDTQKQRRDHYKALDEARDEREKKRCGFCGKNRGGNNNFNGGGHRGGRGGHRGRRRHDRGDRRYTDRRPTFDRRRDFSRSRSRERGKRRN